MATYLRLDIGASDIDLNDRVNYRLGDGWRPRVARRQESGLAGWLYEDVVEEIPIQIFSKVSLDACLDARDALVNALDQAHRWRYGENVSPVLFKYKIDGSSLSNPLQTEVLDGDGNDLLQLLPDFNKTIRAYEIHTTLVILRRGDLLHDEDSDTATAAGPAALMTCTLSESVPLYSPLSLTLAGMDYSTASAGLYEINIPQGVLLIASAANKIQLWEAENYTSALSSPVTDVADAAASGGNYIRMSSGQSVRYTGITPFYIVGDLIGIWAMVHLTSSTDKWSITTSIFRDGSIGADERSETITIDGMTGYKPVRLGVLGRASDNFSLRVTATRTSGSGSFEMDVIGMVALGAPSERMITVNNLIFFDSLAATQNVQMGFRHNRLSELRPDGYAEFADGSQGAGLPYGGNIQLASIGDTVCAVWLAGGSQWRHNDDAGVVNLTMTASRRRAYLAPR